MYALYAGKVNITTSKTEVMESFDMLRHQNDSVRGGKVDSNLEQRLQLIDMHLMFQGRVNRSTLIDHFNVGTATASRTFKTYFEANPHNGYFVGGKKGGHYIADDFEPAYEHDTDRVLQLLCSGLVSYQLNTKTYGPPSTGLPNALCAVSVATVTRAMVSGKAVRIDYTSGTSGAASRTIHPHNIFAGGGAWYCRAFDEKSREFRTFRFSRITQATSSDSSLMVGEDGEWNASVVLSISPHNRHPNPQAHSFDLGMSDTAVYNQHTNAVVAGFLLTDLRVDSSEHGVLNPFEYPLRLLNREELEGVGSMSIAPGFDV